ncbi:CCC motif membrane protein [Eudoraea chungangensis]|uniref:CCC motif membrane protein n=1 Tax=Eudoraea chungangensis TaxID=1481905 RepID=UPI0023EBFF50|nr:CCC motif membrane protein [Eudoraea chungangensis]
MEQEKLPNITLAIVLSILSYICCCFGGLPGALLAGVGYFLVRKDENKYIENPEGYSNYSQLKTAKVLAIIGIVIGLLYFAIATYNIYKMGGWEAYMEQVRIMSEQFQE